VNEPSEPKPKIVVDTDWKAQVEAEKEKLRRQEQQPPSSSAAASGRAAPGAAQATAEEERLPPASFAFLISSLATEAMIALGQLPDPFENKPVVRLSHARHHIDLLGILEEKTQNNLTAEEKSLLTHVLSDLRMAYVASERRAQLARP
jgi:hypothetical protein